MFYRNTSFLSEYDDPSFGNKLSAKLQQNCGDWSRSATVDSVVENLNPEICKQSIVDFIWWFNHCIEEEYYNFKFCFKQCLRGKW